LAARYFGVIRARLAAASRVKPARSRANRAPVGGRFRGLPAVSFFFVAIDPSLSRRWFNSRILAALRWMTATAFQRPRWPDGRGAPGRSRTQTFAVLSPHVGSG